ncbi:hypothetical protein B7H01_22185 [Pandoraea apista]|nr:hypothetical protein B7H01_22185 [Pandoraea apista]
MVCARDGALSNCHDLWCRESVVAPQIYIVCRGKLAQSSERKPSPQRAGTTLDSDAQRAQARDNQHAADEIRSSTSNLRGVAKNTGRHLAETMNQLQAMRVFLNVAETGSFGSAAVKLNLSNAVVTRYVALLEEHLGARLLNRTTRRMSLTETGRLYARGCRQIFDQLDEMEAGVSNASRMPSGELRVASSTTFSLQALTPLLTLYRLRYPAVHLAVDLFDGGVNFIEEGYDVGILAPTQVNSTRVVSRPLLSVSAILVATPQLILGHGSPSEPQELRKFPLLCLQTDARNPTLRFTKENTAECVSFDPVYSANNLLMLKQAAMAGIGGSVLPRTMVVDELSQGKLGQVLPNWQVGGNALEIALIYPGRRNISAKTRTFVEMTIKHFGQDPSL